LYLIAPGKLNSQVELHSTHLLPLMTKKNFELWYKSNDDYQTYAAEWTKLQELLYPEKLQQMGK